MKIEIYVVCKTFVIYFNNIVSDVGINHMIIKEQENSNSKLNFEVIIEEHSVLVEVVHVNFI